MAEDFSDRTQTFSIETPQKLDMQQVLVQVYDALKEKGYNPIADRGIYSHGRSIIHHHAQQRTQPHPQDRPR